MSACRCRVRVEERVFVLVGDDFRVCAHVLDGYACGLFALSVCQCLVDQYVVCACACSVCGISAVLMASMIIHLMM